MLRRYIEVSVSCQLYCRICENPRRNSQSVGLFWTLLLAPLQGAQSAIHSQDTRDTWQIKSSSFDFLRVEMSSLKFI